MDVGIRLFPSGDFNTSSFDEGKGAWLLDRNSDLLYWEAIQGCFGNPRRQCLEGFKRGVFDDLEWMSEIRHCRYDKIQH